MSKAGKKILAAAGEAVAIARGEKPAAAFWHNGHKYVPEAALKAAKKSLDKFRKLDREAATYVESVICLRTDFSGEPPYTGWEGLGLSLNEALDERDRLRDENAALKAAMAVRREGEATPPSNPPAICE